MVEEARRENSVDRLASSARKCGAAVLNLWIMRRQEPTVVVVIRVPDDPTSSSRSKDPQAILSVGNGSSSASLGTDGRRHLVSATSIRAIVTAIAVLSRRCNARSRFVLTVASSPPIRSIAPLSRVAKPLAWFLVHHGVDGAPNAVILSTLHFTR